ncbi:POK11 protein, partial [Mionectes macconnelli]|nr:POK11 protein [Mionectes macconnelli]
KLQWKTQKPVWVNQWPLTKERLQIVRTLVLEQLKAGHIVPTTSPWNTPIFVIPKKSGKRRLLHDLRAINAVMEDMGVLQPGLPSPTMIPSDWVILIIDLKDCFFTIFLHPEDTNKFAFTVPSISKAEPAQRYKWVVLPMGMKNSPTMCQSYVAWALQPFRNQHPELLVYHYMDDILIAGSNLDIPPPLSQLEYELGCRGLNIAPEKVQMQEPWEYLGWTITNGIVRPQKLVINTNIKTLNDVQKLMGHIQWVRPVCGITNDDLVPLMPFLGTDTQAGLQRDLSESQKAVIVNISGKIAAGYASRIIDDQPVQYLVVNSGGSRKHPLGVICQLTTGIRILEWIFLPYQPKKTTVMTRPELFAQLIIKGRRRICDLTGKDPSIIFLPVVQDYLECLLEKSEPVQIAMADFAGIVTNQYPSDKLLPLLQHQTIEPLVLRSDEPVDGVTAFTDAGKKSCQAAVTWQEGPEWKHKLLPGIPGDTLQTLELRGVVWALNFWKDEPINVVSDSLYVVGTVQRLERAMIRTLKNKILAALMTQLSHLLNQRTHPYFVTHIRSHQKLNGG